MQDFRNLEIWQLNRSLTINVYRATGKFPPDERYGLTSQMRRAVISIGSNIAEGCGRGSMADALRVLQMSFSSAMELLHQLITSNDLGFLSDSELQALDKELEVIRRKLARFMARLRDGR
jgi:four helix bundle protein